MEFFPVLVPLVVLAVVGYWWTRRRDIRSRTYGSTDMRVPKGGDEALDTQLDRANRRPTR